MEKPDHNLMLLNAQAEGLSARILLDELRAGHTAVALELLEQRLDTSVLAIDVFSRETDPSRKANAGETLRVLKKYRQRHPRKTEAVIDETVDDLERRKTDERVRKILDETNVQQIAAANAGRRFGFIEKPRVVLYCSSRVAEL